MKRRFRTMSALLTMVLAAMFCAFTFTACSDDEDTDNEVTYTYGFAEMSASHPDFLEDRIGLQVGPRHHRKSLYKAGHGGRVRQAGLCRLPESLPVTPRRRVAGRLPLRGDKHPHGRGDMHGIVRCRQREHLR